jgi:ABC-2 type transport system ATP-binding protein
MNSDLAIYTIKLKKQFKNLIAVDQLDLKIPYGITYGLLGPNGAGKTTTIRILNSILRPTSGDAFVGGYNVKTQSNEVKYTCGFLPETPSLYDKLTAKEFLEFIGALYYMRDELIQTRIEQLLSLFKLKNKEYDLIESYSRGMKQKLCLCSALIHDPKIIFLDEPTSNLDPATSNMVKNLIISLVKRADKTLFICTHLLDVAEQLCDIIGFIDNGKLIAEGSPKEIIKRLGVANLEQAYLQIMNIEEDTDLLTWRESHK